jgi:hypothetical protein
MEPITLKDPLTGEIFYPKKISQRYANPANRIKHNNLKASKLKQQRAFLDKHFHKNHLIIKEIYVPRGHNIFNVFWMEGKGFQFGATNHKVDYKGTYRDCIYEFMILELEGTDDIKIIKI